MFGGLFLNTRYLVTEKTKHIDFILFDTIFEHQKVQDVPPPKNEFLKL